MRWFDKKMVLKVGQIWTRKSENPFGDIWHTKILDIKDGYILAESYIVGQKDLPKAISRSYKESDFRFFNTILVE